MESFDILECYLIEPEIATEGATLDGYKAQFTGKYRICKSAVREGKRLEKAGKYEDAYKKYMDAADELKAMAKEMRSPVDDTVLSNAIGFIIPIVLAFVSWLAVGKVVRIVGGNIIGFGYTHNLPPLQNVAGDIVGTFGDPQTVPLLKGVYAALSTLMMAITTASQGGGRKNPKTYNAVRQAAANSLDASASYLKGRASLIRGRKNKN